MNNAQFALKMAIKRGESSMVNVIPLAKEYKNWLDDNE